MTDEPTFENERGVKFWLDEDLTGFVRGADRNGVALENIVVYLVGDTDGTFWYMAAEDNGKVVFTSRFPEEIRGRIGLLKLEAFYAETKTKRENQKRNQRFR
jgi:hypothetical protein